MATFGGVSLARLRTCDPRLQSLLHEVIKYYDFAVICGHRSELDQNEAYRTGKSQVMWPESRHNSLPSMAVDIAPYPVDWTDEIRFARLMGHVERVANEQGIKIRFGLDWNSNGRSNDERWRDFPHIELVN